jgi:hypothetical protein
MEAVITPHESMFLQRRSKWTVSFAVLGIFLSNIIATANPGSAWVTLSWLLWLGFITLSIWGCADLARSRGYPWQYGFLGLLSIVGYLIVYCLPDRWLAAKHRPTTARIEETNYIRDPERL